MNEGDPEPLYEIGDRYVDENGVLVEVASEDIVRQILDFEANPPPVDPVKTARLVALLRRARADRSDQS